MAFLDIKTAPEIPSCVGYLTASDLLRLCADLGITVFDEIRCASDRSDDGAGEGVGLTSEVESNSLSSHFISFPFVSLYLYYNMGKGFCQPLFQIFVPEGER